MQAFRAHKKFLEKEITLAVNKLTMMKKQAKRPLDILDGMNAHITNLSELKKKYAKMLEEEEHLWICLETRA